MNGSNRNRRGSRRDADKSRRIWKALFARFDKQGVAFVLTLAMGVVGVAAAWGVSRARERTFAGLLPERSIEKVVVIDTSRNESAFGGSIPEKEIVMTDPTDPSDQAADTGETTVIVPPPSSDISSDSTPVAATYDEVIAGFIDPVDGKIVQSYSMDALLYNETLNEWRTHAGVDYQAKEGTAVTAVLDGKVTAVLDDPLYGTIVRIEHAGGVESVYASLGSVADGIEVGAAVKAGDGIGTVGKSAACEEHLGAHLHFELLLDGKNIDPCP